MRMPRFCSGSEGLDLPVRVGYAETGSYVFSPEGFVMLETISPREAMELFRKDGAFFVDVRTEKEFLKRAIPGSPLVPLDQLEREGRLKEGFSGKPVVFFCRSGNRTRNKAGLLEQSVRGKAFQLEGGILAWENAGYPVWSPRELLPCLSHALVYASDVGMR